LTTAGFSEAAVQRAGPAVPPVASRGRPAEPPPRPTYAAPVTDLRLTLLSYREVSGRVTTSRLEEPIRLGVVEWGGPRADWLYRVQVETARINPGLVDISWDARGELLERISERGDAQPILRKFEAAAASDPVNLTLDEKRVLLDILEDWLAEVGNAALPDGVFELRHAMQDDVYDADAK
jgi:hypothetical protein